MTTDAGIDLVAYFPGAARPITIQVKTNLGPKRGGGKGTPGLDWWLRQDSPAEYVAIVDIESSRVWLLLHSEFEKFAQQRPEGRLHLYFSDAEVRRNRVSMSRASDYEAYLLEARISEIFSRK